MLMIRLARVGARKQPYYRVVVIEKDRARAEFLFARRGLSHVIFDRVIRPRY